MWRMVRLLKLHLPVWAVQGIRFDVIKENDGVEDEKGVAEILGTYSREEIEKFKESMNQFETSTRVIHFKERPRVKRKALMLMYLSKYFPEYKNTNGVLKPEHLLTKKVQQEQIEVHMIINSCIDYKDARGVSLIEEDPEKKEFIFLTSRGRRFADVDGLIKEEVVNGLGIMRSMIVVLIVGAVGGFAVQNVSGLIQFLWGAIKIRLGL